MNNLDSLAHDRSVNNNGFADHGNWTMNYGYMVVDWASFDELFEGFSVDCREGQQCHKDRECLREEGVHFIDPNL